MRTCTPVPDLLKRLLSPEYLAVSDPGPLGGSWVLYVILALLFGAGLFLSLRALLSRGNAGRSTAGRTWIWIVFWLSCTGVLSIAGRVLGWAAWSARIWPLFFGVLVIVAALIYRARTVTLPIGLESQLRILGLYPGECSPAEPPPRGPFAAWWILLAIHVLGTAAVLGLRYRLPVGWTLLALPVLLAPQLPLLLRRRLPDLRALTPLLGGYVATLIWFAYRTLEITVVGWQGQAFPNPMLSFFYVDGILLAAAAHSLLCGASITSSAFGKRQVRWQWPALALLVLSVSWASIVYFGQRTHGATASDPFAYAQMGVDLAEHGTFLHRYSLFQDVIPLDINWAPLQPVGYHVPRNELGDCPSVWATGASVLLAAGYKALGEPGLYVTTPIVALLALLAAWALVQEALHGETKGVRYTTGALTVALVATSPEFLDRVLVPMADASAQLFTSLTLLLALRGMRAYSTGERHAARYLAGAGLAFGLAYWARHTQLVLAIPIVVGVLLAGRRRQVPAWRMVGVLTAFFLAAAIAALPDIIYRSRVFGGPLATETTELHAMSLWNMGVVGSQALRDALVASEWGYLLPLALYGMVQLYRHRRRTFVVVIGALVAVLLVHLTYRFLRLRDLISIFPLLDLAVAYGAVRLVGRARDLAATRKGSAQLGSALLAVVAVAWVVLSLAMARWAMVSQVGSAGWASFGYMTTDQREAFDQLTHLTPSDAVIGASLNAGAIGMYAGRDPIRPYDSWTTEEWDIFLEAMQAKDRTVYLLDDSLTMSQFIESERLVHELTPVEPLEIPIFETRDRQTGWLYRLEWED